MAYFYEKDIPRQNAAGKDTTLKAVLHFKHEAGYEGLARESHIANFGGEYQIFLDSKDPKKIQELKTKKIAALKAEIAALEKK